MKTVQADILATIKDTLRSIPGINEAWTFDELLATPFEREDISRYFKLGLFRNPPSTSSSPQERRCGEIVFQMAPYNLVTTPEAPLPILGVYHTSPYAYSSHVPLYIYQHGRFTRQTIADPVILQQFAISLAQVLNVPRPSGAPLDISPLPAIRR